MKIKVDKRKLEVYNESRLNIREEFAE